LTLTGFIIVAVILIFIMLLGFKLGPPYMEYFAVQKLLKNLAADTSLTDARSVGGAYVLRAGIQNITSPNSADLQVKKEGDRKVITLDYSVRVHLVGNLSAVMDFNASSDK
jgi:hypothetical protein